MAGFLTPLLMVAFYGSILGVLVLLARKVRRSGMSSSLLTVWDEIYHPDQERTRIEIHAEDERGDPSPVADDLSRRPALAATLRRPAVRPGGRARSRRGRWWRKRR